MTFFAARELSRLGFEPVVVDAHEVRLKAHRPNQKSDRRDASELCEGLRRGSYRCIVHVPPEPVLRLRGTLSRRRHFVRMMTRGVNAVKWLLRAEGLGRVDRSLRSEAAWDKLLAAVGPRAPLRSYVQMHRRLWSCARERVAALEQALERQKVAFAQHRSSGFRQFRRWARWWR